MANKVYSIKEKLWTTITSWLIFTADTDVVISVLTLSNLNASWTNTTPVVCVTDWATTASASVNAVIRNKEVEHALDILHWHILKAWDKIYASCDDWECRLILTAVAR